MRPVGELCLETNPGILNEELAERLAERGRIGPLLLVDEETAQRGISLDVEISSIRERIHFVTVQQPMFEQAFDKGREYEKTARAQMNSRTAKQPLSESRVYCIRRAAEIWKDEPSRRIGGVSKALHGELIEQRMKAPEEYHRVAEWLRKAAANGELDIPPEARKGGRPKTPPSAS